MKYGGTATLFHCLSQKGLSLGLLYIPVIGRIRTMFSKNINLSPSSERLEANIYPLIPSFDEFEGRVLEVARTANSTQFTTEMMAPPLIDVTFSK